MWIIPALARPSSAVLEAEGYRVGYISQPDSPPVRASKNTAAPKYAFMIGGGNVDSMVARYTVAKAAPLGG